MIELFPMLYWRATSECFIGRLIGTEEEVVSSSLPKLRLKMTEAAAKLRDEESFEPPLYQ